MLLRANAQILQLLTELPAMTPTLARRTMPARPEHAPAQPSQGAAKLMLTVSCQEMPAIS